MSFATLGTFILLKSLGYSVETFHWIPFGSLLTVILFTSFVINSVTYVVITEVMPPKIKEFGISFYITLVFFFECCIELEMPFAFETLTLDEIMFLFAGICLAGAAFVVMFVPETKGKSSEKILDSLQ